MIQDHHRICLLTSRSYQNRIHVRVQAKMPKFQNLHTFLIRVSYSFLGLYQNSSKIGLKSSHIQINNFLKSHHNFLGNASQLSQDYIIISHTHNSCILEYHAFFLKHGRTCLQRFESNDIPHTVVFGHVFCRRTCCQGSAPRFGFRICRS